MQSAFIRSIVTLTTAFLSCISYTHRMEYGTVNVKDGCKKSFCDSKAWSFSLVPSVALWMPAGNTLEEEEEEKGSVDMEGMWWNGGVGGYENGKKRCQLIKHVQLRDSMGGKG